MGSALHGANNKLRATLNGHRVRHTFAVNCMAQNNDVLRLSRILGHTSLAVTDNYLKAFTSRSARQGKSVLDNL